MKGEEREREGIGIDRGCWHQCQLMAMVSACGIDGASGNSLEGL